MKGVDLLQCFPFGVDLLWCTFGAIVLRGWLESVGVDESELYGLFGQLSVVPQYAEKMCIKEYNMSSINYTGKTFKVCFVMEE